MKKPFRFFKWTGKKAVTLLLVTVLLSLAVADVTLSLLFDRTEPLENVFIPLDLRISMDDQNSIKNVGDTPVYVRALAVAVWASTDDEHTISAIEPVEEVDYRVTEEEGHWFLASDGFYYHEHLMVPDASIPLFSNIEQLKEKPGYELKIQIIASSVQAYPTEAVSYAWPAVKVDDNGVLVRATVTSDESNAG